MTDAEIPGDALLRTALQLLPIPAHGEVFWARLEAAFDGEPGGLVSPAPPATLAVVSAADHTDAIPLVEPHDSAEVLVPPAFRRTTNALLGVVAAAAVVVIVIAGSSLLDTGSGTTAATDPSADQSSALDALVADAQADPGTPTTLSVDGEKASSAAVLTWVADLGGGRDSAAWAAMGATSQAHFGSPTAFSAQVAALAQQYATWDAAGPDQVLVTPVDTGDAVTFAVVTVIGQSSTDPTVQVVTVIPVRLVDGVARIEPFAVAGSVEVVTPGHDATGSSFDSLAAGGELVLVVPSGSKAPVLRLDDGTPVVCGQAEGSKLTELPGNDGRRCSYRPSAGISAGHHALTVAFVGADGASITADSLLFDAA